MAPQFGERPWPVRLWIGGSVLLALVLPVLLARVGDVAVHNDELLTVATLLAVSVLNVEIGRRLEGGMAGSHRPHKALSAWGFGSALLLPLPWLLLVVPLSYAHARWRGIRLPLWKWVGSAAYVVLASVVAGLVAHRIHGGDPNWMAGEGGRGLLAVLAAALAFLAVETLLFHGSAYLNDADDEVWLRRTLAGPSFYVTELAVLMIGGLTAAIWTGGAWFLLLCAPVYLLAQRAALHEPLRELAETDQKTGLLRYESWRRLAVLGQQKVAARGAPWSVVFADLDHFKSYNDTWGHLAGDEALAAVAAALRSHARAGDLVGRFGGEEFCVYLPGATDTDARQVAERMRAAIAATPMPGTGARVTVSLGVSSAPAGSPATFVDSLSQADHALYDAKVGGRDRVVVRGVDGLLGDGPGAGAWTAGRPARD